MFTKATRNESAWVLENSWGDRMLLPFQRSGRPLRVALLGTRTQRKLSNKTSKMAALLESLDTPLYVLDTRRNGCGGQGAWAPREFATLIPGRMKSQRPFCFVHLPTVAPTIEMLDWNKRERPDWRTFRDRYNEGLTLEAVQVAAAFVESAASRGGLTVLLCSESYVREFDQADLALQNEQYCHRFTLARRIREYFAKLGIEIQTVPLSLDSPD